jgi:hypothetical protein
VAAAAREGHLRALRPAPSPRPAPRDRGALRRLRRVPQTRSCASCGIEDITYDRGRCPACSLHARLEKWRADGPPEVIARLDAHLTALEQSPNPLSVLQWLAKPGGRTLGDIAAGRVDLSHQALDALERGKSTEDLRAALVHAGVLEARDETLASLDRWISGRLAALTPGPNTTTLRAFATWKVARELAARRARQPGPNALATTMPKRWIIAATGLTCWLHAQDRTLADLDQPLLDQWLAAGAASNRRTTRPFIVWLSARIAAGCAFPPHRRARRCSCSTTTDGWPRCACCDTTRRSSRACGSPAVWLPSTPSPSRGSSA